MDDDAASIMLSSANGTPALDGSRAGTVDSKDVIMMDVDEKKDIKPLPDFELRKDFDLEVRPLLLSSTKQPDARLTGTRQ